MRLPFIILFVSCTVLAAERPKIVVVPFSVGEGASDAAAAKFTRLVTEELKTREDVFDVVAAPAMKTAPAPEKTAVSAGTMKRTTPAPEAVAALEAGKKALADLKFDEASVSLKKGIDLMLGDPATADFPMVLEAYVSLGACAFRKGEEKEASAALAHLARLDPNYQLPAGFPPIFSREFEKAKKKIDKQPKGSVSIEAPPGSTAFVDGRDLGMVPVVEENLAPGAHSVRVEGSRGERYGQTVEIKAGQAKVKASFANVVKEIPAVAAASGGIANPNIGKAIDDATQTRLAAYTVTAGADYAVVGVVYRTGDQLLTVGSALYSARKQGFSALPQIGFDSDVLTANVEAFKLADTVQSRVSSFMFSSLPIILVTKTYQAGTVATGGVGEVAVVAPDHKKEPAHLTPDGMRAFERKNNLIDSEGPPEGQTSTQVKSGGVPIWVWIVTGAAVVVGASVGGYFTYAELSRPVTGTVTATWP